MGKIFTVQSQHSASEMGSGDLNVLSTPSLIAFMENVAKEEAAHLLEAGETTVGIELNIKHIKATAIGKTIRVEATLTQQDHSILIFEVVAYEENKRIGTGTHKRAIVETEKFMEQL